MPVTREQDARQVQRETTLISADVQRLTMGIAGCGGIVQALVEKGSRLLPGVGVIVKGQPVQVEDGPQLRVSGSAE